MSLIVGTCKYSSTPHERRECCVNFTPVAPEVLGTCYAHPFDKPHGRNPDDVPCHNWKPVAAPEKREDGWISVEQELPPAKGKYLVYRINHSGLPIMVAHYNPAARMHGPWHSAHNGKPFVITHWRPLPAPPEVSK